MRLEHGNLFDDTGQSPSDILDRLVATKKITSHNFTELQDAISLFNEVHQCIRLTFGDATQVPNNLPPRLLTFMLIRMDLTDEEQLAFLLKKSLGQVSKQLLAYIEIKKMSLNP